MVSSIFLSPHLDDAVLSCGGRIARQARAGERVQVVTLFAGRPQGALSPFAQSLHRRWAVKDAAAVRRAEDRAALAYLGAEAVHWEYLDCIYRRAPDGRHLYTGEAALWAAVHPADGPLIDSLARRIAALPEGAALYAPLGVGGHVDHQLTRRAAEALGRLLTYYEEYPYGEKVDAVTAALGAGDWSSRLVSLDAASLAARIAAAACYRSQVSTFWADEADMAARIRAYALRVGEGEPAERYWRPAHS
ncbi:MAG: PIG-L family deacetylase [Anaerolineae bacterium]|nr:PIG-L family deacetylase [Anaerolineae bacterium]